MRRTKTVTAVCFLLILAACLLTVLAGAAGVALGRKRPVAVSGYQGEVTYTGVMKWWFITLPLCDVLMNEICGILSATIVGQPDRLTISRSLQSKSRARLIVVRSTCQSSASRRSESSRLPAARLPSSICRLISAAISLYPCLFCVILSLLAVYRYTYLLFLSAYRLIISRICAGCQ